MDRVQAKRIAKELKDKKVGGWTILDYVNNGKSAVVLRATRNGEEAALKIFDPDLVERFGREKQLIRVQREKDLIGKNHDNLIEIKDGGECDSTDHIFVAMAYLPRKNLAQVITDLPRDCIFPIIRQVASAAKFLEDNGLAHRDIKPENIAISEDFSHATLLDLGVLRPVGLSEITDMNEQRVFVGTLRYSPPELLYREEQDTLEGWRAITFYQLGAVLHDMIMQRPIFQNFTEPYARLVDAVRNVTPEIGVDDVSSDLTILASSCLIKRPELRHSIVSWEQFLTPALKGGRSDSFRERIRKRNAIMVAQHEDALAIEQDRAYKRFLQLEGIVNSIKDMIRTTCLNDKECFPRFEIDAHMKPNDTDGSIFVCFRPSTSHHLFVSITLMVFISLLDESDGTLDLRFVASASDGCAGDAACKDSEANRFFRGPYQQDIIGRKVDVLLLALIDKGQELKRERILDELKHGGHPIPLVLDLQDLEESP